MTTSCRSPECPPGENKSLKKNSQEVTAIAIVETVDSLFQSLHARRRTLDPVPSRRALIKESKHAAKETPAFVNHQVTHDRDHRNANEYSHGRVAQSFWQREGEQQGCGAGENKQDDGETVEDVFDCER